MCVLPNGILAESALQDCHVGCLAGCVQAKKGVDGVMQLHCWNQLGLQHSHTGCRFSGKRTWSYRQMCNPSCRQPALQHCHAVSFVGHRQQAICRACDTCHVPSAKDLHIANPGCCQHQDVVCNVTISLLAQGTPHCQPTSLLTHASLACRCQASCCTPCREV